LGNAEYKVVDAIGSRKCWQCKLLNKLFILDNDIHFAIELRIQDKVALRVSYGHGVDAKCIHWQKAKWLASRHKPKAGAY